MKRTNTAVWMEKQNRWQINVQKDGVRKSFYSSTPGRTGQREANAKADRWLDDGVEASKVRTKDILDEYLEIKKSTTGTSNYNKEVYHVENYIRPFIGNKKASTLEDEDFQNILYEAFRHRNKNGKTVELSKKSMTNIRATMAGIAKLLRKKKIVYLTPEDWEIPKGARYKGKKVLQPEDIRVLFSSSLSTRKDVVVESPFIHAYRLLVLTGLRPGELVGLTPKDAKAAVKSKVLKLNRAINVDREVTKGKNENAIRSVILSDLAVSELKAQLKNLPEDGSLFGVYSYDAMYNDWNRYCKYNNIEYVTLYELRHTFVSVVKTMPEGEVKSVVGHSQDMDTFGVYGHTINGEDEKIAAKLNTIFTDLIAE